jgi:hypothetical protein
MHGGSPEIRRWRRIPDFTSGAAHICFTSGMPRFRIAWILLLLISLSPGLHASGKAGEAATLSFHIETDQNENPKMIFPHPVNGQVRYFRRIPEVSTKDVVAFSPFPADGNEGYGILFQLKPNAARRLAAVTAANQGRMLAAHANGRIVDVVLIDQPVNDDKIVIWKGITEAEIKLYDEVVPRIGEKKKR